MRFPKVDSHRLYLDYVPLSVDDFERLLADLQRCISPAMTANASDIKYLHCSRDRECYGKSLRVLRRELARTPSDVRKYEVQFQCNLRMPSKTDFRLPFVDVRVEMTDDQGQCRESLRIDGVGCRDEDFEIFATACERTFRTRRTPPPGMTWDSLYVMENARLFRLDAELRSSIEGAMSAGQFDVALRAAVSVVESRLRSRCICCGVQDAANLSGADLAVRAFHKASGCLIPPWPVANEASHGAQLHLQGFFIYIRNAFAHHSTVLGTDASAVIELLMQCQWLIRMIDSSTARPVGKTGC